MAISTERAFSHPKRVAILDHLASVDLASARQIAEALGLTYATAAYHLRVLRDADMVKPGGAFSKRGAVQRFYAAAER